MTYALDLGSIAHAIVERVVTGYNTPPYIVRGLGLGDVGWRAHVLALRLEQRLPLRRPAQYVRAAARRYRVRSRVVDIARRWAVRA